MASACFAPLALLVSLNYALFYRHIQDIYGKVVDIDIPADVFPTPPELDELEAVAPNCIHGWYPSVTLSKTATNTPIDLHYRKWLPQGVGNPKGILIYTHGIHSHSGHGSRIDGRPLDVVSLVCGQNETRTCPCRHHPIIRYCLLIHVSRRAPGTLGRHLYQAGTCCVCS